MDRQISRGEKSTQVNRIAIELSDTEQILDAIQTQNGAPLTTYDNLALFGTMTERRLMLIWCKILKLEQVNLDDDFFTMGGDSLKAVQLLSLIYQEFQVELPMTMLITIDFNIAELAKVIEHYQISQADPAEIEQLLHELHDLSDEEVQALLTSEETRAQREDEK